jgi:hypothetical protein
MTVQHELNCLLLGDRLGAGQFREVYAHATDPSLVVKLELSNSKAFSNAMEWELWQEVQYCPDIARWFAPCVDISHSGSVLIQKRTKPITKLPAMLPNLFTDLKPANFGRYKGNVVAHDYANNRFISNALGRWKIVNRVKDQFIG